LKRFLDRHHSYGKIILDASLRGNHSLGYNILHIPGKFDFKTMTAEDWLYTISRNSNKETFSSDPEDRLKLRTLKKLWKIAENVELTEEYILVSSFRNIMVDREQIKLEVIDGEKKKDCIKNPYDFDYNLSTKDIEKLLKSGNEEEKQEIFSVTTHDSRKGIPSCSNCKGKGF
jgi:hypothetical protein